jgi:hypothetical protein
MAKSPLVDPVGQSDPVGMLYVKRKQRSSGFLQKQKPKKDQDQTKIRAHRIPIANHRPAMPVPCIVVEIAVYTNSTHNIYADFGGG